MMSYNKTLVVMLIILQGCHSCAQEKDCCPLADTEFQNPILSSGPDPWVTEFEGSYYVTHTTGNNIRLYKTDKITELNRAEFKMVWRPPSSGMNSRNIWAPEIHRLDGRWYIYYAADDGSNENHRMWVLENASLDPLSGEWIDRGELKLPDNKWAIDGSVFELNGQLYFIWSGWEGDVDIRQDIYIAKMENPTSVVGGRILLSKPELPWETNNTTPTVIEGPQFLRREDKMFIVYSAGGCWTDDYTLGLLSASIHDNPLEKSSWKKSIEPVFKKNVNGKVFGPGHNGFFKSPDGTEDWIIYHANPAEGDGCGRHRSIRIQRFDWDEDGTPMFGVPVSLDQVLKKPSGEI